MAKPFALSDGLSCHILYGMIRHMKAQRIFYHKEVMFSGVIEMVI